MHREAQHLSTNDSKVRFVQRAEHREQALGAFDALRIWFVQPVKAGRFLNAERVK